MAEQLVMRGQLEGHSGWVTSLATSLENPNMLLSSSRDKTLIIWTLTRDDQQYGYPKRSLHGHSHIVSDCVRAPLFYNPAPAIHISPLTCQVLSTDPKPGHLLRWRLCPLRFLGQDPPSLGIGHRRHNPSFRRPHQRRPLRLLLS